MGECCRDLGFGRAHWQGWCAARAQGTLTRVEWLARGWDQACSLTACRVSIQQKDPCTSLTAATVTKHQQLSGKDASNNINFPLEQTVR